MSTVQTSPRYFKSDAHLIEAPRLDNCRNSVLNSVVLRELYSKVIVLS